MSGFAGFSEADILKVQNGLAPTIKQTENDTQNKIKPKRKHAIKENRNIKVLNKKINAMTVVEIPPEAKLGENEEVINENNNVKPDVNEVKLPEEEIIPKLEDTTENEKKSIDLDEFQKKQKLMEEQNRRRKELLAKALADRTKRTLEEQQRLTEIQDELKKLDINLSNDVKILRKQIEVASYDYMEAQKKYHRIEKEFLDAKLFLHQKLEKKEMLTEHLCAIIEKNEERKGDKLNELLQKLEMKDGSGNEESQ